ncbi:hypothetical protein EC957_002981 [Mortierella hygrophila]|uniref:Kelch repeat-containing protein n=1 Tax=Mortierella hygrophila TaxID=979708 RepID=A0A9P6F489_9FUNG|nr:hypothetical protein EC957_002981 [Mortierella hygrophila]
MRLILRTLVVYALAGSHIQRAFGQQTPSNPEATTTDAFLTKTPGASPTGQPSSSSPLPVGGMVYAFDGEYLFILGQAKGNDVPQFYTLDLGSSWPANSPAWARHTLPPEGVIGLAGGLAPDKRFLVTSNGGNNTFSTYVYSVGAVSEPTWTRLYQNQSYVGVSGPVLATDLGRRTVYMYLHDNTKNSTTGRFHAFTLADSNSLQENTIASISLDFTPSAASWSNFDNSLLMTYSQQDSKFLGVGAVSYGDTNFRSVVVNGSQPSSRTGHCFVPNTDGSTYYIVGGTTPLNISNEVIAFDVNKRTWTQLRPLPNNGRTQMACAVQKDMLVIWGGFIDASAGVPDSTPLLLDITNNVWLSDFKNSTQTGPGSSPTPLIESTSKSNLGAIIGGIVGGLAIVALVAGFIVFRRRRVRNTKSGAQVLPRGAPPPPSLSGKSAGGQVNVPMNEYTTICSPFVADANTSYRVSTGAPPLYGAPALQPISAPLSNQNQNQNKNGSFLSQPVQPYSMPFQAPPIPVRPLSGSPKGPTIESPFEVGTESSAHHPLLSGVSAGPVSGSIGGGGGDGHYPVSASGPEGAFSLSMDAASTDAASVDLIPCEASEAGDHDQSRSNSIVLNRAGPLAQIGSLSGPVRGKSVSQGPSQSHINGHSNGQGNDKAELVEDGADGRRDSTETLEYLEIL